MYYILIFYTFRIDVEPWIEKARPYLNKLPIPAALLEKINQPNAAQSLGYVAVALLMFKIAGLLRYVTTIALTGYSIKLLLMRGIIKPMPTRAEIKRRIDDSDLKRRVMKRIRKKQKQMKKKK